MCACVLACFFSSAHPFAVRLHVKSLSSSCFFRVFVCCLRRIRWSFFFKLPNLRALCSNGRQVHVCVYICMYVSFIRHQYRVEYHFFLSSMNFCVSNYVCTTNVMNASGCVGCVCAKTDFQLIFHIHNVMSHL